MDKYRNPVSIDKTLYIFERLIIGASFLYFIHILSFLLRKNIFTNIELSKDVLRTLLHEQFKQATSIRRSPKI